MTHPAPDAVTSRLLAVAEERDLPITVADVVALTAAALTITQPDPAIMLTNQQTAVLMGLALGEGTKATAQRLCLSVHTVTTHRRAAYRELGAQSAAHAVAIAMSHGLLRPLCATPFQAVGPRDRTSALQTEVARLQERLAELEKDTAWAATSTPSAASTTAALGRIGDAQATLRSALRARPS